LARNRLHYADPTRSAASALANECMPGMSASCSGMRFLGKGLQETPRLHVELMPTSDTLALLVPIALLLVAIRRNNGVLAALILLVLFIVRL
jgi:uncharacterized membrane protein YpjA